MDPGIAKLLSLAWRTVPGREANEAILKARAATAAGEAAIASGKFDESDSEEALDQLPLARAYELVLAPDTTMERLAHEQLPRLVYHLESLGARLPQAHGIVLCIFIGDDLHFLHAGEALAEIARQLDLTPQAMSERFGTKELQTAQRGPMLALPGNSDHNGS